MNTATQHSDQTLETSAVAKRIAASLRGAGALLILPASVLVLVPDGWPRWTLMWLLAFAIYAGCKWLTWRRTTMAGVPCWRQLAYLLAWPGLDVETFLQPKTSVGKPPRLSEWSFAATKVAVGVLLVAVIAPHVPTTQPYVIGWVGMIGIVFTLHFGLFHILSCSWRSVGIDATPLMDWPVLSGSVSEFWGRRWNRAFRDVTHRFLFRPLTARFGPRLAIGAGFAFSGLVHELVITVPAGGGYGGPTLFFLIQAMGILAERSQIGRTVGLGDRFRGRLFTAGVVLLPLYFLFPPAFVIGIILPFLEFLGVVS